MHRKELSTCCRARPIEDFVENLADHHEPHPIYRCSKCGKECTVETFDVVKIVVTIHGVHRNVAAGHNEANWAIEASTGAGWRGSTQIGVGAEVCLVLENNK